MRFGSTIASTGIDKLTCRRGLTLPGTGLDVLYGGASIHSECVLKSKHA